MGIAGNVNDISPQDYAPPPSTAPAQGSSGNWFADNAPTSNTPAKSTQNVSTKTPAKPQPTAAAPYGISAKPMSFLDRITAPFVGAGSAYGNKIENRAVGEKYNPDAPLIDFNAAKAEDVSSNPAVRGAIRGTAQIATDFTSPRSVELMAATGGLSKIPVVGKLVAAGFGLTQIKGALQRIPEFKKNLADGNYEDAAKVLTEMALGVEMGRRALNHAGSKTETVSRPPEADAPSESPPPPGAPPPPPPVARPAPPVLRERPSGQKDAPAPTPPVTAEPVPVPVENPATSETPLPSTPAPITEEAPKPVARDGNVIWKKGDAVPSYDQVVNIDPHDLKPDPARFQYKQEAIGKGGTTDEFRDVKEWDPGLGGAMAVWQDTTTGEVHPINGHHRTEMAQRTNPPHVNVRFIDAETPTEARTFGAMLNIGEGKGTALDAAKLFRDGNITPEDLTQYKISPTSKLAVQGMALSKLEPTIYRQVVDGKMTPSRGALIGDLLGDDHAAQQAAVDFFKQSDRRGNRYNDAEAADIIRSIKSAPETTEELPTLFGVDEVRKNLFGERAQVSAAIGKRLAKEKGLFALVSKKANAERLSGAGNILNAEDNQKISQEAAHIMAVYDKLKFSSGPVADALNDAAKEVSEGVDLDVAIEKAYDRIRTGVSDILGGKQTEGKEPTIGQLQPSGPQGPSAGVEAGQPTPVEPVASPVENPTVVPSEEPAAPEPRKRVARRVGNPDPLAPIQKIDKQATPVEAPLPRTGPRKLRGQNTPPAEAVGSGTPVQEPQFAKNSAGRVKIGADVKALAEELGSSLYKGDDVQVITKELMQNGFDAIRGTKDGHLEVNLDRYNKTVTIKDNGKGMSRKDLETVFVDLGASGKRNDASASGGFGLAKAAPLMMSESLTVETVNEKGGKRYRSTMTTNKHELLGEGADIQTEEVPRTTPTGTTIISKIPHSDWNKWSSAEEFAKNSLRSIKAPGKATILVDGTDVTKDAYTTENLKLEERKGLKPIHSFSTPGAKIEMYAAPGKKGGLSSMGSIPVEINNHGIFQFRHSIYLGDSAQMEGVPAVLAIDVQATVPEGHGEYPFTANREEMRGDIDEQLRKYVNDNIVKPAQAKATEFISKKYNSLPNVGKDFDVVMFDAGQRLDEKEFASLKQNADFVNLSDEIAQVLDDSLVHLESANMVPYVGMGSNIERAGIVFSKELHGVHITDPKTGKATVFINPFTAKESSSPRQAANLTWHTIKHEILHDKIKGHNQEFTSGLVLIDEALGEYNEAIGRLSHAYADPTDPTKFRQGIIDARKLYTESRDRPEREKDIFKGQASSATREDGSPVRKETEGGRGAGNQGQSLGSAVSGSGTAKPGGVVRSAQAVPGNGKGTIRETGGIDSRGARPDGKFRPTEPPTWRR